jgi:hypothetical protein
VLIKSSSPASQQTHSNSTSREYDVRVLEAGEFARWNEFVRQSPQGTLFHTTLWLEAANIPFLLLGCFRGSEMRGGFALSLLGDRFAGMPHRGITPYLGILFPASQGKYVTEISNNKEIGIAFAAFLKREFKQVDIDFSPEAIDTMPFRWQGFTVGLGYTYRLSLKSFETVFDNMDATRRRNIVSAEKAGITVEAGVDLGQILRLREMSFERQGLATQHEQAAYRFEHALQPVNRCQGFLARNKENKPVGGVWIVWDEKRAYYLLGGYDHEAKSNNAVALAMWRAIQYSAVDLQLAEFDFEGSVIPPVERFFRKFGGTLTPSYRIRYRRPTVFGRAASVVRRIGGKLKRIALNRD